MRRRVLLLLDRPQGTRLGSVLLALACTLAGAFTTCAAQAALVTAGAGLTTVPNGLQDPLGSLSLSPEQFLVPVRIDGADNLQQWQFSLRFDADVATPVDGGGLYASVYQSDLGGDISQITSSGFLFGGQLEDVSGYFAPSVTGNGVIAYVLFQYLSGQVGEDPAVRTGDDASPPASSLPEPSTLSLVGLAALLGAWRVQRSSGARPISRTTHESAST
jgi:hypothetical protein